MKRLSIACAAVIGICVTVVLSGGPGGISTTFFPREDRNPVTHLRWNDDPAEFQFAMVSDRTGSHRAGIFSQAVEKLNIMQPAFVLSVGDLIEGGKKADDKLAAEWKEFDGFVQKLNMPFFYVPGNHDASAKETAKFWQDKLGRRYYHFVYRNVLFLILNADDPPGSGGAIGKEQVAYAQKTLTDNPDVRWTIVTVHRPLWTFDNGAKNGWAEIEKALAGRSYTVFCGHVHSYVKYVRHGMNYYQFATTGGRSMVRGVEYGEMDHIVWVTMKKDGPLLANILIDSVLPENLQKIKTEETGSSKIVRVPTHPVHGRAYFEGVPIPGAVVKFYAEDPADKKTKTAIGIVEPDGSFRLTTYQGFDGAVPAAYQIAVTWLTTAKKGTNRLPEKYANPTTSGLRAAVKAGANEVVLELRREEPKKK